MEPARLRGPGLLPVSVCCCLDRHIFFLKIGLEKVDHTENSSCLGW
jgi:hypothetical protein